MFRRLLRTLLLSGVCLTGLTVAGCKEKAPASTIRVDTYVVRGVLLSTGDPEAGADRQIQVRHEAIPEFRGPGGKLGMQQMDMFFPLAADVTVAHVERGDIVEVAFQVEFDVEADSPVGYHVTSIKELPPDTELDFNPRPDMSGE